MDSLHLFKSDSEAFFVMLQKFLFLINVVLLNCQFIKESWK